MALTIRVHHFITLLLLAGTGICTAEQNTPETVLVSDSTFSCIRDMRKVRGFYVDNVLGDIDATINAAKSATGGEYPAGSVVQLIPGEVMVKHQKGFNPVTKDWEFFELDVSTKGSTIRKRGFADVVNRFGGNCFACHVKAKPQWDLICETGHGCDPIPVTKQMLEVLQKTDPRCENNPVLSETDKHTLLMLKQALQTDD